MKRWKDLPLEMRVSSVKPYYDILEQKKASLFMKRMFDIILSIVSLAIFSPLFFVVGLLITIESHGGPFYIQERITQYGRLFNIIKFRTMYKSKVTKTLITAENDPRITKVGKAIRKARLDELPQLFNILKGDMSFVGPRPEVKKFVNRYSEEMWATLLVPAGLTSKASISFKDEDTMLMHENNIEEAYIVKVLPIKMKLNLDSIREYSFLSDIGTIFQTAFVVLRSK